VRALLISDRRVTEAFSNFLREADTEDNNNGSRIKGSFHTRPVTLTPGEPMPDLDAIVAEFNTQVDQFTCRGSGFVLDSVTKLTAVFARFRPLDNAASSYIQTPAWLYGKHAVINVKNSYQSEDCFKWAVLSALFPVSIHSDRV